MVFDEPVELVESLAALRAQADSSPIHRIPILRRPSFRLKCFRQTTRRSRFRRRSSACATQKTAPSPHKLRLGRASSPVRLVASAIYNPAEAIAARDSLRIGEGPCFKSSASPANSANAACFAKRGTHADGSPHAPVGRVDLRGHDYFSRSQGSSTRRAGRHCQYLFLTQLVISAAFWDRPWLLSWGVLPATGAYPANQLSNCSIPGTAALPPFRHGPSARFFCISGTSVIEWGLWRPLVRCSVGSGCNNCASSQ